MIDEAVEKSKSLGLPNHYLQQQLALNQQLSAQMDQLVAQRRAQAYMAGTSYAPQSPFSQTTSTFNGTYGGMAGNNNLRKPENSQGSSGNSFWGNLGLGIL
jgi:hypothetical protein